MQTSHPTPLERLFAATPGPAPALFLDCDGVIFDTNRLKCDAFRHALAGEPEDAVDALVRYHQQTGGVSRYLKIERFYREMHPVAEPAPAIARALERFGAFCEGGYARLQPRPEALTFAGLFGRARTWVVSGSDEEELRRVFKSHAIDQHFADVHGSPVTKVEHLGRILAAHGTAAHDALFVGDGGGDWAAARTLGVRFVFLAEMSEWKDGPATIARAIADGHPVAVARDWQELLGAALRHLA